MIEISTYPQIDAALKEIDAEATKAVKLGGSLSVKYKYSKGMTSKQQSALHVWCGQVAQLLNEQGDYFETINPITKLKIEHIWTKDLVKEFLYKPTLKSYCGKDSTMDQDTVEPSLISEAIGRAYAKYKGIALPMWPSLR